MNNLEAQVNSTLKCKYDIDGKLNQLNIQGHALSRSDVFRTWLEKSRIIGTLKNTLPLFAVRDAAEKSLLHLVSNFISRELSSMDETVLYNGIEVHAMTARILAMDTYLSINWALYDCLSNVIGRIIGNESFRNNPLGKSNPKLVETFLAQKQGIDVLGIKEFLLDIFSYQIGFSYLMRNCYVHAGGMVNDVPILSGVTFGDAFTITASIAEKLNHEISERYKLPNAAIVKEGDAVTQLQECHSRLDQMFVAMLRFMIGTFSVEIEAFSINNEDFHE